MLLGQTPSRESRSNRSRSRTAKRHLRHHTEHNTGISIHDELAETHLIWRVRPYAILACAATMMSIFPCTFARCVGDACSGRTSTDEYTPRLHGQFARYVKTGVDHGENISEGYFCKCLDDKARATNGQIHCSAEVAPSGFDTGLEPMPFMGT